ncbi:MAG: methylmalonyl-CoA mutase family protein [Candidatus Thermoplasmatota archaeon]|nr:methylmalonyl-CoA mutase family protein [Candidatus Thermoplasmatota archaeon]
MWRADKIEELRKARESYEKENLKAEERAQEFKTLSGIPVKRVYTPEDIKELDYQSYLGFPGEEPFTRGIHPTMYRGKLWTMRQFSGYGTAEETNKRFKYLLQHGETGLSVAFHFPTLYGYDSDSKRAKGEIGKCGVAIDTLKDMEILFDGIPLDKVTTSMTINPPAPILWAMYIAVAEKQGIARKEISGTIQNDMLKEFIAQKTFMLPPKPSLKLIIDTFEFGCKEVPKWNTISISGYHIREAGATAVQELAFTLADGCTYVEEAIKRGLNVDDFAPRLSFFFNAHNDLFEEVAKFRAARRIWAKVMKERFKAEKKRSLWLRFHTQTAGCSATAQQPEINIIRTTIQALAAVLGGTQSLHTNSYDEALALPSEKAVKIALRTQQIIAHESNVANVIDPLGGSYYLEWLTNKIEEECWKYFDKIEALGGVIACIEKGFFQREIASSAYNYQKEIEQRKRIVVGVNEFVEEEKVPIPILRIDPEVEKRQIARLEKVRKERSKEMVEQSLADLIKGIRSGDNLMPYFIKCVKLYATLGEICQVLRDEYGTYKEPAMY